MLCIFQVILWGEESPRQWSQLYEYSNHDSSVNSICWAPREFGFVLVCGSSDGAISVLRHKGQARDIKIWLKSASISPSQFKYYLNLLVMTMEALVLTMGVPSEISLPTNKPGIRQNL